MKIYISIFILLWQFSAFGQINNLIRNGSFESPDGAAGPHYYGLVDKNNDEKRDIFIADAFCNKITEASNQKCVQYWRSDVNWDKKGGGIFGGDCQWGDLHSPDWFLVAPSFLYLQEPTPFPGGPLQTVNANSGSGYIGMGPAELIQQKFDNDNKFIEGKEYTLSLYIRTTGKYGAGSNADWISPNNCNLKVYLRKNDAAYSSAAQKVQNRCTETYNDKSFTTVTQINILDMTVNLSTYPPGQWYPITVTFTAPHPNWNWVIIETNETPLNCDTYLLIDDMTIAQSCEFDNCDRLQGLVVPEVNGPITAGQPLVIKNLENVSTVTVNYKAISGSAVYYSETHSCVNGINWDIYWNGKTAGGSGVAPGTYLAEIIATNNCGPSTNNVLFTVVDDYDPPLTPYPSCAGVIIPEQCCSSQPDIYIDNVTLPGTALINYVAQHNIFSSTIDDVTIQNTANVVYQAGNEIIIGPHTIIENGATFHAFIAPCVDGLRSSDVPPVDNTIEVLDDSFVNVPFIQLTNSTLPDNVEKNELKPDVLLSSLGQSSFGAQSVNTTITTIELMDISGKKIFGKSVYDKYTQLSFTEYSQGIYILRVFTSSGFKNFKIKL